VYVDAPPALNEVVLPEQIVADEAEAVSVGNEFTVKLSVCVALHIPFTPVTV
jgi:hypothetical protein